MGKLLMEEAPLVEVSSKLFLVTTLHLCDVSCQSPKPSKLSSYSPETLPCSTTIRRSPCCRGVRDPTADYPFCERKTVVRRSKTWFTCCEELK